MTSISIESIKSMSEPERADALAIIEKSMIANTTDGKLMIAMLGGQQSVSGSINNLDIVVEAGPDGEFGTADDVVSVKQRKSTSRL